MNKFWILFIVLLNICITDKAYCSPGTRSTDDFKVLDPDNIFVVENSRGIFVCARYNEESDWGLGYQNKKNGFFTSIKTSLAKKNKLLLKATTKKKRDAIKKQIKDEKKHQKSGKSVCLAGPPDPPEEITPTPGPDLTPIVARPTATNTPKATNTPTPQVTQTPCFNGNQTNPGCFGIPSGATGNKSAGTTYYTNNCLGCHGERHGYSYSELNDVFNRVGTMTALKPSSQQDLYDLVAYLNRFSP